MKRRVWLTVGAVVLGGAGVVTIATANPSDAPKKPHQEERAAKLRTLELAKGGARKRELPNTDTEPFSLVGVGWDSPAAEVEGTAQVRTRSAETGKWSGWQALDLEAHRPEGAEGADHGASEPLWVGPSTAVQVRVDSGKALPKNLKLHMVDPGVSKAEAKNPAAPLMDNAAFAEETPSASPTDPVTPTDPASPTDPVTPTDSSTPTETASPTSIPTETASPTATPTETPAPTPTKPTAPPSTVKQPPIVNRAQWGADESMVDDPAEYIDKVQAVFIHHTVGSNNYSCAESAALVRGIMTYHVKTEGWNDLGYNFLVDRYGTIFEGRAGGIGEAVVGAQAQGYNSQSTGIASIGTFSSAGQTEAGLRAIAHLLGWKLGLHGVPAQGRVSLLSGGGATNRYPSGARATFERIAGHRDANATACPGDGLYGQLGQLRAMVNPGPPRAATATSATAARRNVVYGQKAVLRLGLRAAGTPLGQRRVGVQVLGRLGWRTQHSVSTDGTGRAETRLRIASNRTVRARYGGETGLLPSTSAPVAFGVRPQVTVALSASTVSPGAAVRVTGAVAPRKAEAVLTVKRRTSSGRLVLVSRRTVRLRSGRLRTSLRLRRPALYRVRLSTRRDVRTLSARSPALALRVR
jgi:uncharacterized protein with LGFP repeats